MSPIHITQVEEEVFETDEEEEEEEEEVEAEEGELTNCVRICGYKNDCSLSLQCTQSRGGGRGRKGG